MQSPGQHCLQRDEGNAGRIEPLRSQARRRPVLLLHFQHRNQHARMRREDDGSCLPPAGWCEGQRHRGGKDRRQHRMAGVQECKEPQHPLRQRFQVPAVTREKAVMEFGMHTPVPSARSMHGPQASGSGRRRRPSSPATAGKGMGRIWNPKKAACNKIYRKTAFSIWDLSK